MTKSSIVLVLAFQVFFPLWALGAEQGKFTKIETGENPFAPVAEAPDVARVRIPLRFTEYEEILIQNHLGVKRLESKPHKPIQYNLRATINRTNHFYVADWHIETNPIQWQKDEKIWKAELKFYKRFGQENDLEEYVGEMPVVGRLVGTDRMLVLEAKASRSFQNKHGNLLLTVETIEAVVIEKGTVATRKY